MVNWSGKAEFRAIFPVFPGLASQVAAICASRPDDCACRLFRIHSPIIAHGPRLRYGQGHGAAIAALRQKVARVPGLVKADAVKGVVSCVR